VIDILGKLQRKVKFRIL